jgi:hypothetical protein
MSNIVPFNDMQQMAEVAAASKMFGFKNTQEALAIMLLCQGENLHPAVAMRDYHVIQGRPALKADAMLARFQQAGGRVDWQVYTDAEVTGLFSHPAGGSLKVSWTLAQAKSIGIANKDNWKNYPRAMLRARCISEGIRSVYPGCVVGVYTPEEIQDYKAPEAPTSPVKDMGMAEVVVDDITTLESDVEALLPFAVLLPSGEVYASFDKIEDWMECYSEMVGKIRSSTKLNSDAKNAKVQDFRKANEAQRKKLDVSQMALLAQWTAEESKTVPKSQPPVEELHNENPY